MKDPLFLTRVRFVRYSRLFCVEAVAAENGLVYWRAWSNVSQDEADRQARLMVETQSNGRPCLWTGAESESREGAPA